MAHWSWSPEKKAKWSEKKKRLHAAKRAGLDLDSGVGGGGDTGTGDSGGGTDTASRVDTGNSGEGRNRLGARAGVAAKETPGEKAKQLINLPKIKDGLPGLLIRWNQFLDFLARWISSGPNFKKKIYFDELKKEEAESDAEFMWPWLESLLPAWVTNHPFVAFVLIFIGKTVLRFRWADKTKEELENATTKTETKALAA